MRAGHGHGAVSRRSLSSIAREIMGDWERPSVHARPYLEAMSQLRGMDDRYYLDSARTIVRYFLANASTWRGPVAQRVKLELKGMLL